MDVRRPHIPRISDLFATTRGCSTHGAASFPTVYAGEKMESLFINIRNCDEIYFKACGCFKLIGSMIDRKVYYNGDNLHHRPHLILSLFNIVLYMDSIQWHTCVEFFQCLSRPSSFACNLDSRIIINFQSLEAPGLAVIRRSPRGPFRLPNGRTHSSTLRGSDQLACGGDKKFEQVVYARQARAH